MKKSKLKKPYTKNRKIRFKAKKAGVYLIYRKKTLLYVGMSGSNVYKSLYRHFQTWNDPTQVRVTYKQLKNIKVRVIYTNTPGQAEKLEKAIIIKYKPKDNPKQYWLDYETDEKEEKIFKEYIETKNADIVTYEDTDEDFPF